jgi:pyruvate ferredoxin oxidoreductase alpha subunit
MMGKKVGMEVSLAIAEAAKMANTDVIAAYPITPQTHIVERLAELVASGELDAEYIPVESEHSAMSACLGAVATGARTFTATAGQGLELMHEVLYVASAMRLPVITAVANRALSSPLNVWGDQSDLMSVRDTGWIQIICENGQEAFDSTLCAFRIGEDKRVLLPVMIHVDGFYLTHVIEPIEIAEQEKVDKFLPPFSYPFPLSSDKPLTMGAFAPPILYAETKKAQEVNLRNSLPIILDVWAEFAKVFGRQYRPIETYRTDGAKILLLTLGSFSGTATEAVNIMREKGQPVGLLKLRLWRPFPFEALRNAVGDAELLIVVDRALSFGGPGGPAYSEIRSALYSEKKRPRILGFVGGLGGRDLMVAEFEGMVSRALEMNPTGAEQEFELYGVRE